MFEPQNYWLPGILSNQLTMLATIEHLEKIVSNYTRRLEAVPEEE
jgi:hypothetical protein